MEYPKRKCIKSVIITGLVLAVSFALGGCGEKSAADAETETAAIAATETEYTMPTEKEAAVAETEVATEKETETEEPVLFRIRISYGDGVNIGDLPSNKEANEIMWVDRGTEFDVYSIYENEDEGHSYYEVRYNGKKEYVWVEDAEIIE
jgi:predicted small lipoprotein YifL